MREDYANDLRRVQLSVDLLVLDALTIKVALLWTVLLVLDIIVR